MLAWIVLTIAVVVAVIGWGHDVPFLRSIHPSWVSMKIVTAGAFAQVGVALILLKRSRIDRRLGPVAVIAALFIVAQVSVIAAHGFLNQPLPVPFPEGYAARHSELPNEPSSGSTLAFGVLSASIVLAISAAPRLAMVGFAATSLIGIAAMLGYMLSVPILYWRAPGLSSAMAFHTALLFLLSGIAGLQDVKHPRRRWGGEGEVYTERNGS